MDKCIACGRAPIVVASGAVVCPQCRVTAPSLTAWQAVMKKEARAPTPLGRFITELHGPLVALNAVAAHSDDKGIRCIAAAALIQINRLNVNDFFSDAETAKKVEDRLRKLVEETGASKWKK